MPNNNKLNKQIENNIALYNKNQSSISNNKNIKKMFSYISYILIILKIVNFIFKIIRLKIFRNY